MINIINIGAFILTIVKIVIIINNKSEISTNNLFINIFLVILFPFLIVIYFIFIYKLNEMMKEYHFVDKFIIKEFRGFKVNDYCLDIDFKNKRKEEQREILINSRFIYSLSEEQEKSIKLINEFREIII